MAESIYVLGEEDRRNFARLIVAAWADDELKARYGARPREVLAEYGVVIPAGVPTPPLPAKPEGEFSVEQLEDAAGAASSCGGCYPCAVTTGTHATVV